MKVHADKCVYEDGLDAAEIAFDDVFRDNLRATNRDALRAAIYAYVGTLTDQDDLTKEVFGDDYGTL